MQAGFGEVVITPPLGTELAGYMKARSAEGIADQLYTRALVVTEGGVTIALVVADLIYISAEDVAAVRQRITERAGIPGAHTLIAATHTHTGPVTVQRPGFQRDADYMRTWARLSAGAVEIAYRNQVDVTIAAGKGCLPGMAFNRRYRMKNGYVHTNPGRCNPDIVEVAGPNDPEVTVVRFTGLDGVPVGVLVNFACHCDTVGGSLFSADWAGVAAESLRSMLPGQVSTGVVPPGAAAPGRRKLGVVVLNGPCGDINHVDVCNPVRKREWPREAYKIGLGVAAEAAKVALSLIPSPDTQVGAAVKHVQLHRIPLQQYLAESRAALENVRAGNMEKRRAELTLSWADFLAPEPEDIRAEVMCLRIGPVLIASSPGELFCELGLTFKKNAPLPFALVANLSNGYLGYIPSARAYEEGGYESRYSRLVPGSGEALMDAAVELAHQLAAI